MSHQSHRIYYKQPIKFLVLKVNGFVRRFDPDTVQNGHIYSTMKEEKVFPHFLWVVLRILVMDKMSLEV